MAAAKALLTAILRSTMIERFFGLARKAAETGNACRNSKGDFLLYFDSEMFLFLSC